MRVFIRLLVFTLTVLVSRALQTQALSSSEELKRSMEDTLQHKDAAEINIISDCGRNTDIGKVENIWMRPDPPQGKKNLTLYGDMVLKEKITSGTLTLTGLELVAPIPMPPIPLEMKTLDLCGADFGLLCPLSRGSYRISFSYPIPPPYSEASTIITMINLRALAQSGEDNIFCIGLSFGI